MAGILKTTPVMDNFASSMDVYFASSDVDAAVDSMLSADGMVFRDPCYASGAGRRAVVQDPQGAVFEVIRMASS